MNDNVIIILLAELSELADERDLGSRVLWRVGSSPTFRIVKKNKKIVDY